MILMLALISIFLFSCYRIIDIRLNDYYSDLDMLYTLLAITVALILIIIPICSYTTSVEARKTYETLRLSYSQSIEIYEDKAIIDVNSVVTDFRYGGYQESISRLIGDLRNEVHEYNKIIVGKRILSENILVGWFIHIYDDLPTIELKEMVNNN